MIYRYSKSSEALKQLRCTETVQKKKNKYFNKQKLSGRRKSLSTLFSDSSKLIPSKFLSLKSSGLQKIDNLRHYKFILLGEFQTSPISENLST